MLSKARSWEKFPQTMNIIGSIGLKCQSEGALCYDFSFLSLCRSSRDSLSRWTNFAPSLEDTLRLNPASITSRRAWLYFFSLTDVLLVLAQFAAQPTSLLSHEPLTIYIRLSFSATNTAWSVRRVSMYLYDDTSCTLL